MNIPPPNQQPTDSLTSSLDAPENINTARAYRYLLLIGITFGVFEILFLTLYTNDFWFILNLAPFGMAATVIACIVAHFLLVFFESHAGCRLFEIIKHGLPLICYRHWLSMDSGGFSIGTRHVLWQAITELRLTIFGNLQVSSDYLCGEGRQDIVLVFPFHCSTHVDQLRFLAAARAGSPNIVVNKRLEQCLNGKVRPAIEMLNVLTSVILLVVQLDLGRESFRLLEVEKNYHLAQTEARLGHRNSAARHLWSGDELWRHPSAFSWVSAKFFKQGVVAAQLYLARSQSCWDLDRKPEALANAQRALELNPHNFRLNLQAARYLDSLGRRRQALGQVIEAINNRSKLLLPRLYFLAMLHSSGKESAASDFYRITLNDLQDEVFGEEPWWPPGGNRFLSETIYQEDLRFVLEHLLDVQWQ